MLDEDELEARAEVDYDREAADDEEIDRLGEEVDEDFWVSDEDVSFGRNALTKVHNHFYSNTIYLSTPVHDTSRLQN